MWQLRKIAQADPSRRDVFHVAGIFSKRQMNKQAHTQKRKKAIIMQTLLSSPHTNCFSISYLAYKRFVPSRYAHYFSISYLAYKRFVPCPHIHQFSISYLAYKQSHCVQSKESPVSMQVAKQSPISIVIIVIIVLNSFLTLTVKSRS